MIARIRKKVSRWAGRGPWYATMCKTALTHAAVWGGATLVGAVLGQLAMQLGGVRPFFAVSLPLLGYAAGARFYMDRELLAEEADFSGDGWKAKVDAALDFVVPWTVASVFMYAVFLVYSVGGL